MSHLLVRGDARRTPIADGSIHCVVTSPPYFGLRNYGTGGWRDGDPACDHAIIPGPVTEKYKVCRCGAQFVDRQIGLEPTPAEFVAAMVEVFREVKRVLRSDGVVFLNLGDSYATSPGKNNGNLVTWCAENARGGGHRAGDMETPSRPVPPGLKPKDLCLIPETVALALRDDGWYVRAKPPWVKPSPMPESVDDRPSTAHESIFLLARSADYFFDADAVRVESPPVSPRQFGNKNAAARCVSKLTGNMKPGVTWESEGGRNRRTSDWFNESLDLLIEYHAEYLAHLRKIRDKGGMLLSEAGDPLAFKVATQAFKGSHFATFPEKLIRPMIACGTSQAGCCPACGAPWGRVVEVESRPNWQGAGAQKHNGTYYRENIGGGVGNDRRARHDLGWRQTCSCPAAAPVPCRVLDPFSGAGTTGVVSEALGREFVGLDLNPEYLLMARRRLLRPHAPIAPARDEPLPLFGDPDA